jgi:hypothetical protein
VPSPSGTPDDEPAGGRPPADWDAGYNRDARYDSDAGYDRDARYYRDAGHSPSGYDADPGRDGGYAGRGSSEPGYADPAGYNRQDSYSGHNYSGHSGGRAADDQQSGWPSGGQQQGWPQDYQQSGTWPHDDQQHGWPSDYPAAGGPPDRAWYPPGQEALPQQPGLGGALEALPPAGETHHDWSARRDQGARGWPAPGQDEEGEAW